MLFGKEFSQNALKMTVKELLRHRINTLNLIKPVLTMMYVRTEREGEWPLHIFAIKEMIPYFSASCHINYTRYSSKGKRPIERQILHSTAKS